jgi:hypothetical protein
VKEYLFSYGTLQKDQVQLNLFGRLLPGIRDRLIGYKIVPIDITDEQFLSTGEQKTQLTVRYSNDKNDIIEGTVFGISANELLIADKYEPDNYKRISVKLESGKRAWIYAVPETLQ